MAAIIRAWVRPIGGRWQIIGQGEDNRDVPYDVDESLVYGYRERSKPYLAKHGLTSAERRNQVRSFSEFGKNGSPRAGQAAVEYLGWR
jgi:hypothetical protein